MSRLRAVESDPNTWLVAALSAAILVLLAAAAVGARNANGGSPSASEPSKSLGTIDQTPKADGTLPTEDPNAAPGATTGPGASGPGAATGGGKAAGPGTGAAPGKSAPLPSQPGATREGVFTDYFKFGVHAPMTIDGAPLNLAEDPVTGFKGYITYLNRQGGVNGRKVKLFLEDDRYTVQGGAQARDKLVKEVKPFFISGTLGVDQIAIVAKAAGEAKIPYMAIGGPEPEWKNLGMFQVGSSYDQYSTTLAKWICAQGAAYVGGPVRLGITTLDTPYIKPVEERFVARLESFCGLKVDPGARGYVDKPTNQQSYLPQMFSARSAYNNQGANLFVPLQDPVTTSRQIAEWKTQNYRPKWTFANFAHDSDTMLALAGGDWAGVRGLSGACYYQYEKAFDTSLCANMKQAHDEWLALGQVSYDENAAGCKGSENHCDYKYDQASWDQDGSGGAAGYQLVHFWLGAMKAIGADPTRERFVAALLAYDRYSDLITSPITFKGSGNIMRGAEKMAVLEANANPQTFKFRQASPGLVDQF